jgi:hypothetical protein
MRRRVLAAVPCVAVLTLAGPFFTGTAQAGTPGPTVQSTDGGSVAFFEDDGDDLYVCDSRADGHSAVVQWIDGRNPGKVRTFKNSAGNGKCRNALAGVNLAEGSGIVYFACLGEGTKVYNCGEIGKGKA